VSENIARSLGRYFFESSIVVENTAGLKTPVRTKLARSLIIAAIIIVLLFF